MLLKSEKKLYDFLTKSVCPDIPLKKDELHRKPRLVVIKERKNKK